MISVIPAIIVGNTYHASQLIENNQSYYQGQLQAQAQQTAYQDQIDYFNNRNQAYQPVPDEYMAVSDPIKEPNILLDHLMVLLEADKQKE